MKLILIFLALAATSAAAQPNALTNRATSGMIQPLPVVAAPRPIAPTVPQCKVVMVPVPGHGPEPHGDAGQLSWSITWNANVTAAQRVVIQYALDEWRNIILDTSDRVPNPYPITIQLSDLGPLPGLLALTSVSYFQATGNLAGATMSFNTQATFFVDPTPGDDSEFNSPTPPANVDLLTVARHELGHAVGFTQTARVNAWLSNGIFDGPRLNIVSDTTSGVGFHTSASIHPNDIMNSSIGNSVRQPISLYPAAALVARAFDYRIPMTFVDPNSPGSLLTGTVNQPYQFLQQAPPSAGLILLAPTTHHVPVNQFFGTSRTIMTARGGSFIVAP